MVGRLLSSWDGTFSGAMLNFLGSRTISAYFQSLSLIVLGSRVNVLGLGGSRHFFWGRVTRVPCSSTIPSLKLTVRPWKWMVGILLSYWGGLVSGATLVSGRVNYNKIGRTSPWNNGPRFWQNFLWTKNHRSAKRRTRFLTFYFTGCLNRNPYYCNPVIPIKPGSFSSPISNNQPGSWTLLIEVMRENDPTENATP